MTGVAGKLLCFWMMQRKECQERNLLEAALLEDLLTEALRRSLKAGKLQAYEKELLSSTWNDLTNTMTPLKESFVHEYTKSAAET